MDYEELDIQHIRNTPTKEEDWIRFNLNPISTESSVEGQAHLVSRIDFAYVVRFRRRLSASSKIREPARQPEPFWIFEIGAFQDIEKTGENNSWRWWHQATALATVS